MKLQFWASHSLFGLALKGQGQSFHLQKRWKKNEKDFKKDLPPGRGCPWATASLPSSRPHTEDISSHSNLLGESFQGGLFRPENHVYASKERVRGAHPDAFLDAWRLRSTFTCTSLQD